jgi:phosphatidylglycerol:prolipoprotein diacylglycerol transferase
MIFHFPEIDPVALSLGPVVIRWYALSYIAGILSGYYYLLWLEKRHAFFPKKATDDLILYAVLGIILGGRLGYVLFYNLPYYFENPTQILHVWQGGMAFHGGLIGVLLAFYLFARRFKLPYLRVLDRLAIIAPLGIFFGRMANFINGELVGRVAGENALISMVFPHIDALARHPSQLYQAFGEGLLLWLIMLLVTHKTHALQKPGHLGGLFILGYGIFRFIAEFFRMPDAQLGLIFDPFTMGQILCVPMVLVGAGVVIYSQQQYQKQVKKA